MDFPPSPTSALLSQVLHVGKSYENLNQDRHRLLPRKARFPAKWAQDLQYSTLADLTNRGEPKSDHFRVALHVAGIWFITSALGVPVAAQTPSLKVTEWASKSGPLLVRSGIIEGPTEIGLVDTQFSNANTHRLIANLIETGKPLRWVYVTHPHVDHFNGATLLRAAFPNAKFYAQLTAIPLFAPMVAERQAGLGAAAPGGLPNVTAPVLDFFEPVPADGLAIDGRGVEIIRGVGDHPDSSVV